MDFDRQNRWHHVKRRVNHRYWQEYGPDMTDARRRFLDRLRSAVDKAFAEHDAQCSIAWQKMLAR